MGKPITLDVLANVRDFQKGTDVAGDALDDVADALDDVVRDGDRASERLERSFRDIARAGSKAGDDVGDDLRRGFKRAEDGAEEFKDEAQDTMRETAASISSVEDGLDAVQEIAANAFAGFGPAGAAAGLVAATGIGLVTAEIQSQIDKAAEFRDALTSAYKDAVTEGRAYLDEAQIIAAVHDIMFDEDKKSQYEQAIRDAETLGVTINDVLRAQAGDEEKINLLREAGRQLAEDSLDPKRTGVELTLAEAAELGHAVQRAEELKKLRDENVQRAERALEIQQEIADDETNGNTAAKRAIDQRGAALQAYADKAKSIPDPVLVPKLSTWQADGELSRFIAKQRDPITLSIFYKDGATGRRVLGP
jgi:hypothetical protein